MDEKEIQDFILEHMEFITKQLGEDNAVFYKAGFIDGVFMLRELSDIQREKSHMKQVGYVNRAIQFTSEKVN